MNRKNAWTYITGNNDYINKKIKSGYTKGYIRIKTVNGITDFTQYFQVVWYDIKGESHFNSFRIYCDEEENEIYSHFPNIAEYTTYEV